MPVTAEPPTAADLAWEATRGGLSVLEPEHRAWFEDAAAFVAAHWPIEPGDEGMLEPDDADELRTRLAVAETTLEAIAAQLDIDTEDQEHLEEAIAGRLERERQEGTKDATIPSRANTAQRKALRLLVDGRLELQRIDHDGEHAGLVVAECKSESGDSYTLGYDPHRRQWRCTCQELRGQCSHLTALKIVVAARSTG